MDKHTIDITGKDLEEVVGLLRCLSDEQKAQVSGITATHLFVQYENQKELNSWLRTWNALMV